MKTRQRPVELEKKAVDKGKEERIYRAARAEGVVAGAAGGAGAERSNTAVADRRQNELKDAPREVAGARAAADAAASKIRAERDAQTNAALPATPPVSPGIQPLPQKTQAEPQLPPPAPQQQTAQVAESVSLRQAAAGRAGSADQIARRADEMQLATGMLDITVPGSSIRWRVAGGMELLRSADGGATWQKQTIEIATPIAAGTAPSSTVCWLVGRSGIVLLTTDGATWRRVAFPEAVDLKTVAAPDARSATVTAVDGRIFVTADGGQTWTRR